MGPLAVSQEQGQAGVGGEGEWGEAFLTFCPDVSDSYCLCLPFLLP